MRNFDWISEVNNILSKNEIGIEIKGGKVISEIDVILNYFASNISILDTIPEVKKILVAYLKAMEKIGMAIKTIFREKHLIEKYSTPIKIGDSIYYLTPDKTIFSQEDVEMINQAYTYLIEAFKQLARKYLYTLLAGIPPKQEEERYEFGGMPPYTPYFGFPAYVPPKNTQEGGGEQKS